MTNTKYVIKWLFRSWTFVRLKRWKQTCKPHCDNIRCSCRRHNSPPVPPPGELDEKYASSLILAHSLHDVKTWRHPQNRKYITYCITVRWWPSHGHRQYVQKMWWNLACGFWDRVYASGQTHRHADRHTSHPYLGRSNYNVLKYARK